MRKIVERYLEQNGLVFWSNRIVVICMKRVLTFPTILVFSILRLKDILSEMFLHLQFQIILCFLLFVLNQKSSQILQQVLLWQVYDEYADYMLDLPQLSSFRVLGGVLSSTTSFTISSIVIFKILWLDLSNLVDFMIGGRSFENLKTFEIKGNKQ